jgi:hypothetical protein
VLNLTLLNIKLFFLKKNYLYYLGFRGNVMLKETFIEVSSTFD